MEVIFIKGYYTGYGYMGLINGKYRLFATEEEYAEIFKEEMKDEREETRRNSGWRYC